MKIEVRYQKVLAYFQSAMPDAASELHFDSPFHLLVAVMLSAQCTDKRVNMVTPMLFAAYPDAHSMAEASVEEIFSYVHSVSYPNSKSTHLQAMAKQLMQDYDGVVPNNLESLQTLPGVGRKTANVVLAVAFGQPAMPVDTHVFRVANRIGLTYHSTTPLQTEMTLVRHIPQELLSRAHHWLILHGRYVCTARKPRCADCGIAAFCRSAQQALKNSESSQ